MNKELEQSLSAVLQNWQRMQTETGEDSEENADRFESSFYEFIDVLRDWIDGLEKRPTGLEDAAALPEIQQIMSRLPGPLSLNFETELELILERITREEEEKYD
ncbi:hypothetical protein [Effusibacillus consociatus]|uniref:Uncharacterized protein n=1 Tax=Effusibacillus consociatus TaxID=1117041 RepID=A0ABV9Q2L3_9BACL